MPEFLSRVNTWLTTSVHLRGIIEEKFRQKDNWDMKITVMSLLSEMRDKLTKSITVILDLHTLSSQLLDNLDTMLKVHGEKYQNKNCSLRFQVRDREEAMLVDLPSKSFKVNPSDDLMAEIFKITNVQPLLV
ncbi:hypothetical protein [Mucilaginibacter sp. L3T2-6]|uniref:hypothetical protein n=1 Tax=Mucilaginibacter sp. L3T2-6 TaxID=3062491 RepID=UPI002675B721|nr:hypothetical protein [Mucilaginibacter sp. L3T2-6]MDO3642516.1 hypothetical protein [Mucilaginibacter sp. L3T2-6]MDV6215088.1 hypothetical protein [Mucilaginibacter sp. L3T2-6]